MTQRQMLVWGEEKLAVLRSAHVVIAGVGGLGCVVADQMVRSGIGSVTLLDDGVVEVSDLGRQMCYFRDSVGLKKVKAAARHLARIAQDCLITPVDKRICRSENSLADIMHQWAEPSKGITVFADCLDNYEARFAFEEHLPAKSILVHAGIEETRGQVTTLIRGSSKKLCELYAGAPELPASIPVIPQACHVVAGYQSLVILHNIWWEMGLLPQEERTATLRGSMAVFDLSLPSLDIIHLAE